MANLSATLKTLLSLSEDVVISPPQGEVRGGVSIYSPELGHISLPLDIKVVGKQKNKVSLSAEALKDILAVAPSDFDISLGDNFIEVSHGGLSSKKIPAVRTTPQSEPSFPSTSPTFTLEFPKWIPWSGNACLQLNGGHASLHLTDVQGRGIIIVSEGIVEDSSNLEEGKEYYHINLPKGVFPVLSKFIRGTLTLSLEKGKEVALFTDGETGMRFVTPVTVPHGGPIFGGEVREETHVIGLNKGTLSQVVKWEGASNETLDVKVDDSSVLTINESIVGEVIEEGVSFNLSGVPTKSLLLCLSYLSPNVLIGEKDFKGPVVFVGSETISCVFTLANKQEEVVEYHEEDNDGRDHETLGDDDNDDDVDDDLLQDS